MSHAAGVSVGRWRGRARTNGLTAYNVSGSPAFCEDKHGTRIKKCREGRLL